MIVGIHKMHVKEFIIKDRVCNHSFRSMAWCNKSKHCKAFKTDISKELMSVAWNPTRWWDCYKPNMRKKSFDWGTVVISCCHCYKQTIINVCCGLTDKNGTIKEWVQDWWVIDMMFRYLNVSQRTAFSTIQKKVLAHKHRDKNKITKTKLWFWMTVIIFLRVAPV